MATEPIATRVGGSERLVARARAIGREKERDEVDVILVAQIPAISRRHGGTDEREQVAGGAGAPRADEVRPREFRRLVASSEFRQMAARAVRQIHCAPGIGLSRGVGSHGSRLARGSDYAEGRHDDQPPDRARMSHRNPSPSTEHCTYIE